MRFVLILVQLNIGGVCVSVLQRVVLTGVWVGVVGPEFVSTSPAFF